MAVIERAPTAVTALLATGQPPESLKNLAAPGAVAARARAVSADDYETIVAGRPGVEVGRASALPLWGPQFFDNGGTELHLVLVAEGESLAAGLKLLDQVELGLLCLPGETDPSLLREAVAYATERRAFLIVDPVVDDPDAAIEPARRLAETGSANAAVFYPPLVIQDPLTGQSLTCPAGPAVAGLHARTDATRGVWKAAAGTEAALMGAERPVLDVGQAETRRLVAEAINPIRTFPGTGPVVWGARAVHADWLASEWKYVPVRRLALLIEGSIDRGTRWAVFEPNDEPLWARLRTSVEEFLHDLFRDGAFPGATPDEAFWVRCDRTTMTQDDIDAGRAMVEVGFAPIRPAEFVVLRIRLTAAPGPAGKAVAGEAVGTSGAGESGPRQEPKRKHERPTWWTRLKAWVARLLETG